MIASAAVPLFIEQGASVTTRQIADELGIAEGTIFRAFGDKESLTHAVVEAFFEQVHDTLAPDVISPTLDLEEKLHAIIRLARIRAKGTFAMLSLLDPGEARTYMRQRRGGGFAETAAAAFATDIPAMNVSREKLAAILRLLIVAVSAPQLHDGDHLTDDDLVAFVLHGIAGDPRRIENTDQNRKA